MALVTRRDVVPNGPFRQTVSYGGYLFSAGGWQCNDMISGTVALRMSERKDKELEACWCNWWCTVWWIPLVRVLPFT